MFLDWTSKPLCHLPFRRRTVNSHQFAHLSLSSGMLCPPAPRLHGSAPPADLRSSPTPCSFGAVGGGRAAAGDSRCSARRAGFSAPLLLLGPSPSRLLAGAERGCPGRSRSPRYPARSLQPQDVLSHHLKLAPGWTAAEATAGPLGLGGMCGNCCSREKHFPCSLRTAFVCLCSDTNLFNCLGMIGFSPWN